MSLRHPVACPHLVHLIIQKYMYVSISCICMTDSTEDATSPTSTKSRNKNSLVQIQIKTKCQFEFVPRDTEGYEFLDSVTFRDAACSVETVMYMYIHININVYICRLHHVSCLYCKRALY